MGDIRVYLVHHPHVFLSDAVRAPSPNEAAGYGVDNLSVTSYVGLPRRVIPAGRIVPPRFSVVSMISVISTALG